eukprot:s449_g27.t1
MAFYFEVLYQSHYKSIAAVVESHRAKNPVVKVAYHTLTDEPKEGKPGHFSLKKIHSVWYVPQSAGAPVEEGAGEGEDQSNQSTAQQTAAKLIPNPAWQGHSTQIVFSVKFGINGVMPIRPQAIGLKNVVLTRDVDLPAGRCAELF